jgi:hypothetical protein
MARGERVARVYVAALLVAQALVTGTSRFSGAPGVAVQVIAALALLLPFVHYWPTVTLRAVTVVPAVGVACWWSAQSSPLGAVAWLAWAGIILWLCAPADLRGRATLAERFHPVVPRQEHRAQ